MEKIDYQHVELPATECLQGEWQNPRWLKNIESISWDKWYANLWNKYFKHVAYHQSFIDDDKAPVSSMIVYEECKTTFYHPLENQMAFKLTHLPDPQRKPFTYFPWENQKKEK